MTEYFARLNIGIGIIYLNSALKGADKMMRKLILVGILVLAMSGLALAQDFPKYEVFVGYSYLRSDLGNATSWLGSYYNSDFSSGMLNGHGFEGSFTYNLNKWFGIKGDISTHFGKVNLDGTNTYTYDYPDEYYNGYTNTQKQKGSADVRQYTYLFGPEFSYRGNKTFRPFAHALLGFTTVDVHKLTAEYLSTYKYENDPILHNSNRYTTTGSVKGTAFAMAFGGGVDINVNKRISLRMPQIDYIIPNFRSLKVDAIEKYESYNSDNSVYYTDTYTYKDTLPAMLFHNVRVSAGLVFKF
jgi:hypothetical protein